VNVLTRPLEIGQLRFPPPGLIVAATVGAILLLAVALDSWAAPQDESAYWYAAERLVAGEPLYDPEATLVTPYTYFYPPPLAQVLAPLTLFLPHGAYIAGWTALLGLCVWWLAGRRPLETLALVAFLPVAIELLFRNVHLLLAVLVVLGLRRWPGFFAVGAAIKVAPGLGLIYFLAARRWRDAAVVAAVGLAILAVSLVVSPGAWSGFLDEVVRRGGTSGASLVPVPFPVRAAIGFGLAAAGGLLLSRSRRTAEVLLVVGIVAANPSLYVTGLSVLAAILPLWRSEMRPRPNFHP
jgi:hypothetical protein